MRRAQTDWDTKPHRPIFYGPFARLSDVWAGRRDGKAGLPPLPTPAGEPPQPHHGRTPYLAIRDHHFLDRAERERRHMQADLASAYTELASLDQEIAGAEEKAADLRKRLDDMPEAAPREFLASRNAIEQHADEKLVRARRQREYDAKRATLAAEEQQAVAAVRKLRVRQAAVAESVAARERVLEGRVRQLHEHTWRRCRTYQRRLAHHHPERHTVLPYLELALPALPGWLSSPGPPGTWLSSAAQRG